MSLFTNLRAWFTGADSPVISSSPPQVTDTPTTPPSTIDCYVEGLIKSITESPSEWRQSHHSYGVIRDYWFTHDGTGTMVSRYSSESDRVYVAARGTESSTSLSEDFLPSHHARLAAAVKLHLETPLEEATARKIAEVAATTAQRKQEAMIHFACLGCPESGGSQS